MIINLSDAFPLLQRLFFGVFPFSKLDHVLNLFLARSETTFPKSGTRDPRVLVGLKT